MEKSAPESYQMRWANQALETANLIDVARAAKYQWAEDIRNNPRESLREDVARAAVVHAALLSNLLQPVESGRFARTGNYELNYNLEAARAFLILHSPFTDLARQGFAAFANQTLSSGELVDRIDDSGGSWAMDAYEAWLELPLDPDPPEQEVGTVYVLTQEALRVLSSTA